MLAIAYCLPEIGYCQGMNFIASCLISLANSEEQGFYIFMFLLIRKDMKTLFLPVSFQKMNDDLIGRSRAASQELSDCLADQIPYPKLFPTPPCHTDVS